LGHLDEAQQVLTEACSLAEKLNANSQLWTNLESLASVNSKLGKPTEAEANREAARVIIQQIAESLHKVGLSESFLNQPRILALLR
jgi:hypothetical protein